MTPFESRATGIVTGVDSADRYENAVVGVAAGYAESKLRTRDITRTTADLRSLQAMLYGRYDLGRFVLSGLAGAAWHDADQIRRDVGGITGDDAYASYGIAQYFAQAELSRGYAFFGRRLIARPYIEMGYQSLDTQSYTETGTATPLKVTPERYEEWRFGSGTRFALDLTGTRAGRFHPEAEAGYSYALKPDIGRADVRFAGGGSAFPARWAYPERELYHLGAALAYEPGNSWTIRADYRYDFREGYESQTGLLRASWRF